MTQEERKRIEDACSALYSGKDYKVMYLCLNQLLQSYSRLLAEHNNSHFGDIPEDEASNNLYTISTLINAIEPLIKDDIFKNL